VALVKIPVVRAASEARREALLTPELPSFTFTPGTDEDEATSVCVCMCGDEEGCNSGGGKRDNLKR